MGVMPTLPTLDVSQAHYDRIVAAFPGATLAEKAANYQAWLINELISEVERLEHERIQTTANQQISTAMAAVTASLPPRRDYPPRAPMSPPLPGSPTSAGGTLGRPTQ